MRKLFPLVGLLALMLSITMCAPAPYVRIIETKHKFTDFPMVPHTGSIDVYLHDEPWPDRPYKKVKLYQFVIEPNTDLSEVIDDLKKQAAEDGLDAISLHGNITNPHSRSNTLMRVTGLLYLDDLERYYDALFRYEVYKSDNRNEIICFKSLFDLDDMAPLNCNRIFTVNKSLGLDHKELSEKTEGWKVETLTDNRLKRSNKINRNQKRQVILQMDNDGVIKQYDVKDKIMGRVFRHEIIVEYDDMQRLSSRKIKALPDNITIHETYIYSNGALDHISIESDRDQVDYIVKPRYFDQELIQRLLQR